MRLGYAKQYGIACVIIDSNSIVIEANDIIEMAEEKDAVFYDGPSPDDKCYCVQFPGRPKELYTEQALLRMDYKS